MKKFHFILLLAIFACSPDNDEAIVEQQSTSSDTPESMNLESGPALNRDSGNLIYKETFENPELYNNPQAGDFYLEHAENHSFSIEENIVKEGSQAGRFEIKKSDSKIWGGHRTEMSQAQNTARAEGWYGFSQYFPTSYTSGSTGEVIGQWHDQADKGEHVDRS
ncbi:MAG: heparin lyase I family protein, partial [Salegentibacter mishustinae]|nr:heparin lyase I family protein [Salegentibacter mishustinae]